MDIEEFILWLNSARELQKIMTAIHTLSVVIGAALKGKF
jgi:hypothetical protein